MFGRKNNPQKPLRNYVVRLVNRKEPEYVKAEDVECEETRSGQSFHNFLIGDVTVAHFPADQVAGITSYRFAD